jgi:hypothetical protein
MKEIIDTVWNASASAVLEAVLAIIFVFMAMTVLWITMLATISNEV